MKVTAIAQTITMLEQEIEALEQRRGELLRVIDSLRPLAGEGSATRRSKKALKRTDGRTDGRSKARARSQGAKEPP